MANLAIRGHATRGNEVIEILEMLGGKNIHNYGGTFNECYAIDNNKICTIYTSVAEIDNHTIFTLEQFEEKYPYKVGDKVTLDNKLCSIIWMCWECNNIYYQVQGIGDVFTKKVTADELKLYKERNNMGKKLAIKGHPTRGKEVIQLLEMLGANRLGYKDTFVGFYYYIECGAICSSDEYPTYATNFTLEEFLEKYPYKVGDKVEFDGIGVEITGMYWLDNTINYEGESIKLGSKYDCLSVQDLKPYKEETMKEKTIPPYMDYDIKEGTEKNYPPKTQVEVDKYLQEHSVKNVMNVVDIETCLEMDGLKLPENVVINSKGIGSIQFIQWYEKLQYPKTYEECCKMLGYSGNYNMILTTDVDNKLFNALYRLKVCRDAYWKIAGEQMSLGKPWKPDWKDDSDKYFICYLKDELWMSNIRECNRFLVFPTKEMRDAFYECFKELIEECKELL